MQNMKVPDDLFSMLLTRLGMKQNILPPELRTQVDSLAATLRHGQWSIRVAAVQALGKLEGQVPVASLVVALLADEHEAVRAAASRQLGELGERVPVEPLIYALDDPSWMVRADAAYALGKLGVRTPIEPLVKAMKDEDVTVRVAAVQALGEMRERAPIHALVSTLDDEEWLVREAVVLALGKMGERAPIAPLMEAVHDEDETVREVAKLTLQRTHPYGLPETVPSPSSPSSQSTNEEAEQMPHAHMRANDTDGRDATKPKTRGAAFQDDERFSAIFVTLPLDHTTGRSSAEVLRNSTGNTNGQHNGNRPLNHPVPHDPVLSEKPPPTPHSSPQAKGRPLLSLILMGLVVLVVVALILVYVIGHP